MRVNGVRKFVITLLVFSISCVLLLFGKITADNWVSLNIVVIPTFIGANLVERWMNKRHDSDFE